MKNVLTCMVFLCWILSAVSLTAAGVVLTKQTPSESEAYWKPIEFGSIENYPTSVVITPKGTKQTSTITRYQIGVVIEFMDLNATSIVSEDQFNKFKAARDSLAGYASQCKQAAGILSDVVQNYDQVLRYYADGNVLIAGKWISKHDYEAKLKADALAATAGSIPELVSGGKTFKNVRVTKVVGDRISIMHEGGIASLHVVELNEETLMKFEIAFPRHFQQKANKSVPASKSTDNTSALESPPQMPIRNDPDKPVFVVSDTTIPSQGISLDLASVENEFASLHLNTKTIKDAIESQSDQVRVAGEDKQRMPTGLDVIVMKGVIVSIVYPFQTKPTEQDIQNLLIRHSDGVDWNALDNLHGRSVNIDGNQDLEAGWLRSDGKHQASLWTGSQKHSWGRSHWAYSLWIRIPAYNNIRNHDVWMGDRRGIPSGGSGDPANYAPSYIAQKDDSLGMSFSEYIKSLSGAVIVKLPKDEFPYDYYHAYLPDGSELQIGTAGDSIHFLYWCVAEGLKEDAITRELNGLEKSYSWVSGAPVLSVHGQSMVRSDGCVAYNRSKENAWIYSRPYAIFQMNWIQALMEKKITNNNPPSDTGNPNAGKSAPSLPMVTAALQNTSLAENILDIRKMAEHGDVKAKNQLGDYYAKGNGVVKDDAEANKWYRQAAEEGYSDAQFNLGLRYATAEGIDKDVVEAWKWLTLSAEQGNATAARKRDLIELTMTTKEFSVARVITMEWRQRYAKRHR